MSSELQKQQQLLDALALHWGAMDAQELRQMQQIAGVLHGQRLAVAGANLRALQAIHKKILGGTK
jgi:hypothetical protein